MPSQALTLWRSNRLVRLAEIETQCAASLVAQPPNPPLMEENLRGYAVLLSAHFQGFCRDLYTECADIVASKVRPSLRLLFREQFSFHLTLNHGNPSHENIKRDFQRFGFKIALDAADPANPTRLRHLSQLMDWRNVAAHQGNVHPPGVSLTLANLQSWRDSCDGLAVCLDAIMYNQLRKMLRRQPWAP